MPKKPKTPNADELADLALAGENVLPHFKKGKMVRVVSRVNLDLSTSMLRSLDSAASEINVTRQSLMKMLLKLGLDQWETLGQKLGQGSRPRKSA